MPRISSFTFGKYDKSIFKPMILSLVKREDYMDNLKTISKEDLRTYIQKLVRTERKITAAVLKCIAEVDRRKLHLEWGFSSLFDYLTNGLGYSESAAYRRMQGALAFSQIPELEKKIEDGKINLSQITQVQVAVKAEQKLTGKRVLLERKREIFAKLENKNKSETDKILDCELTLSIQTAQVSHKKDDSVEMTLRFPKHVYELLVEMKSEYSHVNPDGDWVKVIELMALELKKRKEKAPKSSSKTKTAASSGLIAAATEQESATHGFAATAVKKHIPASVKRYVFKRDQGKCQYKA
jgi:hypothetical protein